MRHWRMSSEFFKTVKTEENLSIIVFCLWPGQKPILSIFGANKIEFQIILLAIAVLS